MLVHKQAMSCPTPQDAGPRKNCSVLKGAKICMEQEAARLCTCVQGRIDLLKEMQHLAHICLRAKTKIQNHSTFFNHVRYTTAVRMAG
jgi:hypothetical protein